MARRFKPINWDADLALSFERNLRPVIVTGEISSRFGHQFCIVPKGLDGQCDDGMIAVLQGKGHANETLSIIPMEAANGDVLGCARDDEDFGHKVPFRVSRGDRAIADGGAVTNPVVNSRDRAAGGPV